MFKCKIPHYIKEDIYAFLLMPIPIFTLFGFQSQILIKIAHPILQLLSVFLLIFINWGTFKIAHSLMKQVKNHYYCFNFILTVSCFSLAGFSQDELRQFGFIIENNSEGMFYYFIYKTLFNVVGFYHLPSALSFFVNREKLIHLIRKVRHL